MARLTRPQWNEMKRLRDELFEAAVKACHEYGEDNGTVSGLSLADWDDIRSDVALFAGTTVAHIHLPTPEAVQAARQGLLENANRVGQLLAQGKTFEEAVSTSDTRFCLAKE